MITLKIELDFDSKEQMESFKRDFEKKFDIDEGKLRYIIEDEKQ